jgi:LytS/YehU family sensor histidine kinase
MWRPDSFTDFKVLYIHTDTLAMTKENNAAVTLISEATIPQIYGQFSSHKVGIHVTIPTDMETTAEEFKELTASFCDNLRGSLDTFCAKTHPLLREAINSVCISQGKPEFFAESADEASAPQDVNL